MTNKIPEAEALQHFNTMLDQVAVGDAAPDGLDPEIAGIAATLAMPTASSLSRRRAEIRARVVGYRAVLRRQQVMRFAISSLVIALAAATTYIMTTMPQFSLNPLQLDLTPTYAYSGDVLGEFRGCIITNGYGDLESRATIMAAGSPDPWDATRTASAGTPEPTGIMPDRFDDPILAGEAAGFEVWVPQYTPGEPVLADIIVDPTGINGSTLTYQHLPADNSEHTFFGLSISQSVRPASPPNCEFPIGDALLMHVTVRGLPAYWIEDRVAGVEFPSNQLHLGDSLLWEEAGFYFHISHDDISLSEAQAIAQSMIPASQLQP